MNNVRSICDNAENYQVENGSIKACHDVDSLCLYRTYMLTYLIVKVLKYSSFKTFFIM